MVVRWKARGTYRGGFPGAPPGAVGREVAFTGADTLRIAGGKLTEYRANAGSLLFFQQPGVRECPPEHEPPRPPSGHVPQAARRHRRKRTRR
jgi:hypothetical protein